MADVLIFQTPDGGEVTCTAGQILLDDGVASVVYISLWGGNEDDSGSDADKPKEFWANKIETDATKKIRSRTQALLRSIPATSGNLRLIEEAVAQDLAWMLETKLATFVGASVSIPRLNWVNIEVSVEIQGKSFAVSFAKKVGLS